MFSTKFSGSGSGFLSSTFATWRRSGQTATALLGIFAALGANSCFFDSPPIGTLPFVVDGILGDPTDPVVLEFHEAIDYSTLSTKIITLETGLEGRLFDEDEDPTTEMDVLMASSFSTDVDGSGSLGPERRVFTMIPRSTLPIGPQLAVLIEPGLADDAGNAWQGRQILKFGYEFSCGDGNLGATVFPERAVFFVQAEIDTPVKTQLQFLAVMRVNPQTGNLFATFTNADRDPTIDCGALGLNCAATEVCRSLPAPACVIASERVASPDEYVDFTHNAVPPTGYSFTGAGCISDVEENVFSFANAPADVKVETPEITVKGITFSISFSYDANGVLRGAGTFTATDVFLGATSSGPGAGTGFFREVPEDEVPAGTPEPDTLPE